MLLNLLTETIEAARYPQSPHPDAAAHSRQVRSERRHRPLGPVERDIRPLLGATPQTTRLLTRRQSQNNTIGFGRLNPPA